LTNGDLLECDPLTRILFIGLWIEADRRGILEDRPKTIKVKVLPADSCDVDAMLNDLRDRGFIERYVVNGVRCIKVTNFEKHQNPHVNEKNNDLPDVPSIEAPDRSHASTVQTPDDFASDPADSLLLNPDPLLRTPETRKDTDAGSDDEKPEPKPRRSAYSEDFEAFWSDYPKGHGIKSEAFAEWRRLDDEQRRQARDALPAFRSGERWQRGFILDAQRFLKKLAFESPPEPWTPPLSEMPEPLRKRCENWTTERLNDHKPVTPYPRDLQAAINDYLASMNGARR
jgi:hypothetical protein